MKEIEPPSIRRDESFNENFFNGKYNIKDPYRYLEDPDSIETKEFVKKQNEYTNYIFENKIPDRKQIKDKMKKLYNYEKYSTPIINTYHKNRLYYYKNNGLQNQFIFYMLDRINNIEKIILDPNTIAKDGTAALGSSRLSNGIINKTLYFAYGICHGGSDWQQIKILDITDNNNIIELKDTIDWVKFTSISWLKDDTGFFYSRFPAPKSTIMEKDLDKGTETQTNENHQIYFHRLGTNQSEDILIFEDPLNPKYYINSNVSNDGRYLLIKLSDGCKNACKVYIYDLTADPQNWLKSIHSNEGKDTQIIKLIDNMDFNYEYLTNDGSLFYFKTNLDAPREKIIKGDINNLINKSFNDNNDTIWETIISEPENGKVVISDALVVYKQYLIVSYLEDVQDKVRIFNLNSIQSINNNHLIEELNTIPLPKNIPGTIIISGSYHEKIIFYKFVSFLMPGTIYEFDITNIHRSDKCKKTNIFNETKIQDFNPENYITKQYFIPSLANDKSTNNDKVDIPLFLITNKKTLNNKRNDNPVYMYGYGGFNISLTPNFSIMRLLLLLCFENIVIVIVNLRGGGEYGEKWHEAGIKTKKKNVFMDFHSVAHHLIHEMRLTNCNKIAIHGGSNGGLLVAACLNDDFNDSIYTKNSEENDKNNFDVDTHPNHNKNRLYKCGIVSVGVLDMLRFHKFTCGHGWRSDYGDPDNLEEFTYLLSYSPLHNIKKDDKNNQRYYSDLLLTTGDHDDRVVPLHSYKFISELQYVLNIQNDIKNKTYQLIRIETKAGHGAGKPTEKILDEYTDIYAFMAWSLHIKFISDVIQDNIK